MLLSGALEQLYIYWKALPRDDGAIVPARFHMLPTDLKSTLPRVSLLKRKSRYDVQVSMINTSQNEGWCGPFLGMNAFDLTAPHMRENSARLYEALLSHPCGAMMREEIRTKNGKVRQIQSLYLPLSNIHGEPAYLLICSVCLKANTGKSVKAHDRLLAGHDHVIDIECLDIGAGIPTIEFENHTAEPSQPDLSHHWWDRFMPNIPGWFKNRRPVNGSDRADQARDLMSRLNTREPAEQTQPTQPDQDSRSSRR